MNIKEVRVGNYLLGNQYSYEDNYEVFQVESIHPNGLNVWDGREMGILADYEWENVKPIPLDKEWLVRLGFEELTSEFTIELNEDRHELRLGYWTEEDEPGYDEENEWCYLWYGNETHPLTMPKYVHQLQNLYFALTGNELSAE